MFYKDFIFIEVVFFYLRDALFFLGQFYFREGEHIVMYIHA